MLLTLSRDLRDCYQHAEDCAQRATVAVTAELRSDFLKLEQAWLTLARSYEFTTRVSDFSLGPKTPADAEGLAASSVSA